MSNVQSEEHTIKMPYSKLRPSKLDPSIPTITELERKYGLLANKVDDYKASLLDAESKLQVAYEMLETQGLDIKKQ